MVQMFYPQIAKYDLPSNRQVPFTPNRQVRVRAFDPQMSKYTFLCGS